MMICKGCFRDAHDINDHRECFEKYMTTDLGGWLDHMNRRR